MAAENRPIANGVKTGAVGSVSASVSGENRPNNHNHNNNLTDEQPEQPDRGPNAAKKQWHWLSWMRIFPPNGRNSASARVVPKSSEIPAMENVSGLNNDPPPAEDNSKKLLNRFQYVFDNAKNDPKSPVYCKGLFRGYLAFDTGQPFHYRWLCIINFAVLYNLIFVIGRSVFWALDNLFPVGWYVMDYTCDLIYLTDLFIRVHEGIKRFEVLRHWFEQQEFE